MGLYLLDKVKTNQKAFGEKVESISKVLGIDPAYLMAAMYFETAGTMSPSIQNETTHATGLIQFMPSTALGLGTTVDALKQMSNVEQLDYVYKYFLPYKGKMKTMGDLYLTIFYPVAVGKPDTYEFPNSVKVQNPAFSAYWVDGKLTKGSIEKFMAKRYPLLAVKAVVTKAGPSTLIFLLISIGLIILSQNE